MVPEQRFPANGSNRLEEPLEVVHLDRSRTPSRALPVSPHAVLISRHGRRYEVGPGGARLGRLDAAHKIFPDIDLTAENPSKTVHRRHARIYHQQSRWYLEEELGARNGTFVNRRPLKPEEPVPLNDGDRIQLSRKDPVELTFRILG